MRARTNRALRVTFPAAAEFRELAVRLVSGAGLLVEAADPDFRRELVATFEGLLDRMERPEGGTGTSRQITLAIEHGEDFLRIQLSESTGPEADAGEADAAAAPREASLLVRCALQPARAVRVSEHRSTGGLRDSEPGRR